MGVLDKFLDAIKLNDEDDDYLDDDLLDDEDEDLLDDEIETKPKKKFFEKFSRKRSDDDLEEIEIDDEPEPAKTTSRRTPAARTQTPASQQSAITQRTTVTAKVDRTSSRQGSAASKITPMRSSRHASGSGQVEVCVIKPTSMESTKEIADTLIQNATVILNLEGIDVELAQRIIDFTSGSCYSLGGSLQKVSSYIFVLGPSNVDITGDMQSILGGSAPSVRAGY